MKSERFPRGMCLALRLCGLKKRAPRIMVPVRWLPISLLRGVFNPLSGWLQDRHRPIRQLIRRLEGPG